MQFSSGIFLMLFLPLSMIVYKLGGNLKYKNIVLLISSFIFYAWGEPLFVFMLIFGILANYLFGLKIEKSVFPARKNILIISLIFNIGILFVFKYLTFVLRNFSVFFNVTIVSIALPIGISFYTFQIMSYIFDVYYEKVPAQKNMLNLALYISMFPQLVAGPIVRYSDIELEIRERKESFEDFSQGVSRFIVGLSKKVLLADFLGGIADKIFIVSEYSDISMLTAWIGAAAYTFEIYYDFSGYSDMAIGLGKCFGFHFQENFNYPYMSTSITEFWRRWHISLTNWFRDYVYIPLGGNRVSEKRHIANLFVVWLLTGIWHGAEWTFILWGMVYFLIQLLEKRTKSYEKIPRFLGYILTMIFVTICWVIFRAANFTNAMGYLKSMFGLGTGVYDIDGIRYGKSAFIVFVMAYLGSFPVIRSLKRKMMQGKAMRIVWEFFDAFAIIVLLVTSLFVIINGSYSPFIYFNF